MQPMFDVIGYNLAQQVIQNATSVRRNVLDLLTDPKRDIDAECGYPPEITIEDYRDMYDRFGIATRVVDLYPTESWMLGPEVFESEDMDDVTPFEQSWKDLAGQLRGQSFYEGEEGNPVWEYLQRVDQVSGIGTYGALLIGFDDVQTEADLQKPVEGLDKNGFNNSPKPGSRKVLFLRAFDESLLQVVEYESDPTSRRFGMPKMYHITFNDPRDSTDKTGVGLGSSTLVVHWTRVLHAADNLLSSECFGSPRQEPVFNHILDLKKLYGGSAEMYWKGAFPGLSIESHPQLGGDVIIDKAAVREELDNYQNSLQRYLVMNGLSAKTIAPQVVDPTPQIKTYLEAICITLGVPMRIFLGSERGELSSSQDSKAWNNRLMGRQNGYITPRLISPFVDRLIFAGVLVPPTDGYKVKWTDLNNLTDEQRATIAQKRVMSMAQYVSGGVESIMSPLDFLTRELGFSQEEGQQINDSATELAEQRAEEDQMNAELNAEAAQDEFAPDGPNPNRPVETPVQ